MKLVPIQLFETFFNDCLEFSVELELFFFFLFFRRMIPWKDVVEDAKILARRMERSARARSDL